MKKIVLALAASAGLVSPALAADTHAAWQGFFTVTGTTAACAGIGGTSVGDTNVSIYRAGLSSTDLTSMSIIFTRAAINFQNDSETNNPQMRGSGTTTVRAMNGKGKPFQQAATFSNIVTAPASILAGTANVTITGTLNDMWNTTGCNVTFKATYSKQL